MFYEDDSAVEAGSDAVETPVEETPVSESEAPVEESAAAEGAVTPEPEAE